MFRTRWLAIWSRSDIPIDGTRGSFKLSDVHRKGWNDEAFSFAVPEQIQHQLTLKTEQCLIYGDVDLLPPNKRAVFGNIKPSVDAVLKSRCIRDNQFLPTLVASYTQQHNLARSHLQSKGIFAYLIQSSEGFAFIDPFRFASLLGATSEEIVALPVKIEYAFRNLGNAISVPHALLAILVGLSAVKLIPVNIANTIRACWNDKITTANSIVCRNKDYAFIVPHALVSQTIAAHCIRESTCISSTYIRIAQHKFQIDVDETVGDFLRRCGIDTVKQSGIFCIQDIHQIPWSMPFKLIIDEECSILHKYRSIFRFICIQPKNDGDEATDELDHDISEAIDQIESSLAAQHYVENHIEPTIPYEVEHPDAPPQPVIPIERQIQPHHECTSIELQRYEHIAWDHFRNSPKADDAIAHLVIFTNGRIAQEFRATSYLSCDAIATRVLFCDPDCNDRHLISAVQSLSTDKKCVFIASPITSQCEGYVPIVIHNENHDSYTAKFVEQHEVPWNIVIREFPNVRGVKVNGNHTDQFVRFAFSPGDSLCVTSRKRKQDYTKPNDGCIRRIELFRKEGVALATDELNWILQNLRQNGESHEFLDRCDIDSAIAIVSKTHTSNVETTTVCPILHNGHWCACEIHHGSNPKIIGLNFQEDAKTCFVEGLGQIGLSGIPISFARSPVGNGLCGWVLVHRWCFNRHFEHNLPGLLHLQEELKIKAFEVLGPCPTQGPDVPVWTLAARIRLAFIRWHVDKDIAEHIDTGAVSTDNQDVGMKPIQSDPVFENDPWAPPKDRKMCKWEDLKMPNDHHFRFKSGEKVSQVHRQQLNDNTIGIAFATKAHVVPLFTTVTSSKVALLIPASDKPSFDGLPKIAMTGPFEVVVQDSALSTIYKRQVLLIQHSDEITFQLPKPSYSANPPALTELVLEVDERLLSKDAINVMFERPLEFFKKKFVDQLPTIASKQLHIYAFRTVKAEQNRASHRIFQAMTKVTSDKRALCIERSGIGELFIRDFIPKGSSIEDITTLPRFWQAEKNGQADALKASSGVEGYAGLTLTKRGIAVRAWCSKLAPMRTAILADDDRVCQLNLATVPRVVVESTGWPASIGPSEVVKAVYHEVKAAPIPTRCYKILGVTTWSLAFDSKPAVARFLCQLNGASHEIILTTAQEKQNPVKPAKKTKGEGKGKSGPKAEKSFQAAAQKEDEDPNTEARLTALEVKFGSLERRQDSLENRINEGFGSVNDQLHQVLNAIQPRANHDHTGATPPPKQQKTGN